MARKRWERGNLLDEITERGSKGCQESLKIRNRNVSQLAVRKHYWPDNVAHVTTSRDSDVMETVEYILNCRIFAIESQEVYRHDKLAKDLNKN